jgi:hypothetical protein
MSGYETQGARRAGRSWAARLIRRSAAARPGREPAPLGRLHAWVLSLPFVVERPRAACDPGVRLFAVDCPPLGRRRTWLTTGPECEPGGGPDVSVSVVLPVDLGHLARAAGWTAATRELAPGHVLVTSRLGRDAGDTVDLEPMLLAAYTSALG